ncbi:MAG TPA: Ig-like domain-containing protein [Longimicrobiales bacterium]
MLHFVLAALIQQTPAPQTPARPALHVVVSPANPTVVAGDSLRLQGAVHDASGKVVPNARIRWFGGTFEGRVDTTGMVRAGSRGTLVVFAVPSVEGSPPGAPSRIPIRVLAPPAAAIEVSPQPSRLIAGQRIALSTTARARNGDVTDDVVTWTSSAPNVVRVSADGVLEAIGPGSASVTASAGNARSELNVTVLRGNVGRVEVTADKNRVRTGDVVRLHASAREANGTQISGVTPAWSVSPANATISSEGAFVAEQPGVYTVTAAFGNTIGTAVVNVAFRDAVRPATVLGRLPLPGVATAEFWPHPNGQNAYLSTSGTKLYALNISNTSAPAITDSVIVDARHINDVMTTADGKYAVLTREGASSRRNGIVIMSLEDPAHPKVISEYTETVTGGVHSIFVYTQPKHGTHVFLTDDATGSMRVIDLNDPLKPREIARWQTARPSRMLHDIDIRDGLAYLSYWNDGLVILDIGNGMKNGTPAAPQLVSQLAYDLEKIYRDVEAEGGPGYIRGTHTAWRHKNYVFVGDEVFTAKPIGIQMPGLGLGKANGRLHVVDVSDISKPRIVAHYEPKDGGVHNVWVAGDTLYVGDYQGGLRVVDISGELMGDLLAQGREISKVHTGDAKGFVPNAAMAWGAFYHNGVVWVNDMFSGLWIVRIEPKSAKQVF